MKLLNKYLFCIALTLPGIAFAEFAQCRSEISDLAVGMGITPAVASALLHDQESDPKVIRLDRHQPEKQLLFSDYAERLVSSARIATAKAMLNKHHAVLHQVEQEYGVEKELLVALWGIETDFGRVTGNFDPVNALLTLACDTRRPSFFRRELLSLMALIDEGKLNHSQLVSSWAGAMGYLQFLPSVIKRHGVDLDGDSSIAIFAPSAELFVTAARFLAHSGWQQGQPWGYPLATLPDTCRSEANECEEMPAKRWHKLGLQHRSKQPVEPHNLSASIIQFRGDRQPAFIAFPNLEALLKWNRSNHYAVAAGMLYDELQSPRTQTQ
jgi:membrane-bound lytic murein transglycosylase B